MERWRGFIVAVLALLVGSWVCADTIYLRNGRLLRGTIIYETESEVAIELSSSWQAVQKGEISGIMKGGKFTQFSVERLSGAAESVETSDSGDKPEKLPGLDDWEDEKDVKAKSSREVRRSKPGRETTIKIGYDFQGQHSVNGSMYVGNYSYDLGGSEPTDGGMSLSGETISYFSENAGTGVGVTFQLARKQANYSGNFSFIPIYGILKLRSMPGPEREYLYAVGHLGFNLFLGDNAYKGSGSLVSGMYYAGGAGAQFGAVQIELLYTVNRGSYKSSGYTWDGWAFRQYSIDGTVDYSKLGLLIGVSF